MNDEQTVMLNLDLVSILNSRMIESATKLKHYIKCLLTEECITVDTYNDMFKAIEMLDPSSRPYDHSYIGILNPSTNLFDLIFQNVVEPE